MEIRKLTIFLGLLVLAISQCSEGHSMQRREAIDDIYDDPLLGDEATDDETMNDTDNSEPQPQKIKAVIETPPKHYEVKAGENVTLECKVTPDKGTVAAWFAKDSQYFMGSIGLHPEETRYSIVEDTKDLMIRKAQLSDSGVFRCETLQKEPVGVNHTLLVLQAPIIINMSASNGGRAAAGGDIVITCLVAASPVPTVLWSVTRKDRGNERLTEKDADFHVEGNLYSMHIKDLKKEDTGAYYCYALNRLGSHQAETTVVVNGKPQVHVAKTIVNSAVQIKAVLQCAAHEEIRPHIRWYKDGQLIENNMAQYVISTSGSHSNLTVSPAGDADFGTFTCEAENEYGTHNRSIELVQSPVVEDLDVNGPRMTWTVHSHQPLEEMEVQLKSTNEDGDWTTINVPLPEASHHRYEVSFTLEDKQLQPGKYMAVVKVKNSKSWGGTNEPAFVTVEDPQSLYIQTASVYRQNSAHSIRPVYTALSTILMYLLVRML
ncbi:neural cell adhesion molecule 1-like [Helicoverpa zea]|uniref:neural cell adhesion molecule 1-like n=1 Tax=Helicoverpa zea TaxID=7113 RepID=UPI001F55DBAB|nr:neural cell adhesion molecule 1-like [Helicoverpa zea]